LSRLMPESRLNMFNYHSDHKHDSTGKIPGPLIIPDSSLSIAGLPVWLSPHHLSGYAAFAGGGEVIRQARGFVEEGFQGHCSHLR
jgi:hypothetical protein